MERIYHEDILLSTNDCDMTGGWKPSAIMNIMQECAGRHGTALGFGRDVLDPLGLVWVVSRLQVQLAYCPHLGDTVTVTTFPTAARRLFFPRYFTFLDANGHQIGCASTLWLLMDASSRRMAASDLVKSLMPDNSDQVLPMGMPSPEETFDAETFTADYTPVYADLDVNGHVNNTRYMDLCCNALGINTLRSRFVSRFYISYDKEILADQHLITQFAQNDDRFSFSGFSDGIRHFDISGTLSSR